MIAPEHERAAAPTGPAFTDAVTVAWADGDAGVCGLARIGLSPGPSGSALAVLFVDDAPAAAVARGGVELPEGSGWGGLHVSGLRMAVDEPLQRWRVACDFSDGSAFAIGCEAIGAPAELPSGGMTGYEQLCSVSGTATVDGEERRLSCLGQRGHAWGEPDWNGMGLARSVGAWFDDGSGVALAAARPAGARAHADEAAACALLGNDPAVAVGKPRLSTTYDSEGRQLRAGLELWVSEEDEYPHRGAGRAVCGSTLDLGQLRLDCAFFEWSLDGRRGLGRYDILRRADGAA